MTIRKSGVLGGILGAVIAFGAGIAQAADTLRIAVLEFGTVNWELTTIKNNGFDTANGFEMEVLGLAGNPATQIAFQGGEADVIVSDWIWVARQRAEGKDYRFIPYSTAVGSLLVPEGSEVQSLEDLKGSSIGIAGGPLDKSWVILRAYTQQEYGFDIAEESEQVFGAPPLIMQQGVSGEVDGAINFWHFLAKMKAAGMREVISVADASEALGLDPNTPLLGYVVKGELVESNPQLVAGLAAASQAAKDLLATDEAAWDALRPMMRADKDADFAALKEGFRQGIPQGPVDPDEVAKVLEIMAQIGGEDLVGEATTLPEGLFYAPGG